MHTSHIFCLTAFREMGFHITMQEDCDCVKAIRPLLLSIFNTSNEMCSCFKCAVTFTIYQTGKRTQTCNRNSEIRNNQVIIG